MNAEFPPAPVAAPGVMTRLREETADLHAAAESQPLQKSMVSGSMRPETFVRWLGQMLLVHEELERRLAALRNAEPRYAALIRDELFQAPQLRADLARMGADADTVAPLPATTAFVARIGQVASESAEGLLGALYVLEGSKNGNRFIAKALERRSPGAFALGYLDPHGEAQRDLWQRWKLDMDMLGFEPAAQSRLVAIARETFAAITRLSQELDATA